MNKWFLYISLLSVLISFISSLNAFRLDMPKPFKYFSFFSCLYCYQKYLGWPGQRNYISTLRIPGITNGFITCFTFAVTCFTCISFMR